VSLESLIADGNKQAASQDGNHVVLEGHEWDLLVRTLRHLQAERDGALEIINRYDEIKSKVQAQVFAWDAIQRASGR
jgi:hypothetical protein